MRYSSKSLAAVLAWVHVAAASAESINGTAGNLPIVDLGYNLQQASTYNSTEEIYTFSNIRFAQAPVGDLRFRRPLPPLTDRSTVHNGSDGQTCPNAYPSWLGTGYSFINQYLSGQLGPVKAKRQVGSGGTGGASEDCLFLDVVVPKAVFERADNCSGVPVLVWIYGGGYTLGSKNAYGSPAGLIAQARELNGEGVVYVAMNYRLGAFGWLAGPSFQYEGGVANAGLYDQRLALHWIQKNIAKFGGNPHKVTVFGESAGGGSIMHQITAFGDGRQPPFQQAVLQSPGWQPYVSNQQQEGFYQDFLSLLNVTTLDQARKLPSSALQAANAMQVQNSSYGGFTYGPAVDGVFSPSLPGQLLARGQFPKNLKLILGHNADEGLLFTPPVYNLSDISFDEAIRTSLPTTNAWPSVVDYLTDTLYPNSSYINEVERTSLFVSESIFTCNTFYLDKAYSNKTFAYLFAVPPALHGDDIAYTFYNGARGPLNFANATDGNTAVALALQGYITHFAIYGKPSLPGVPYFPMYGKNASLQVLNNTGITQIMDPTANERCNWWQKALYY